MRPRASRIKGWARCVSSVTCGSGAWRQSWPNKTDEAKLIEEFLRRKYRGKELGTFFREEKNLAGAFRRLRYAGFSAGQSIKVLKRFASQPEVLDALESEDDPLSDENRH
jgi:hypothetical protein